MEQGLITCPNCGNEFGISGALTGRIREHLKAQLQHEAARQEAEFKNRLDSLREQEAQVARSKAAIEEEIEVKLREHLVKAEQKATKRVEDRWVAQFKEIQGELAEKDETIRSFRQQEMVLRKRQRQLEEIRASMDIEIIRRLDAERDKIRGKAEKELASQHATVISELEETLEKREKSLEEFRSQEIELRSRQRELVDGQRDLELGVARKLDGERESIRNETLKEMAEEYRLKDLEKDKVINDLRISLDDMKRRAEQGSMETQGEVLERDFEAQLRSLFIHDDIQPVPKGIRGADLIQTVRIPMGAECGILLWEAKNTKAWSAKWIPKLRDDMIDARASMAILVSAALPPDISRFGQVDGIWVCDPLSAIPLAAVLRVQLIAVDQERTVFIGKNEKMEALYQYLAGSEFKQKIEGIVEAFTSMQDQLNKERRSMGRVWKQREKEIERVIKNTVGLYGDMQGIIGGRIPTVPALELDESTPRRFPGMLETTLSPKDNQRLTAESAPGGNP